MPRPSFIQRQALRENTERRRDYEEQLKEILKRADILDAQAMTAIQALMVELQQKVIAEIQREITSGNDPSEFTTFWRNRLLGSISDVLGEISRRARLELKDFFRPAYEIGFALVDRPLEAAAGIKIGSPDFSLVNLNVLNQFSNIMVTAIDEQMRDIIDRAVRIAVADGSGPNALIRNLESKITTKGTPFRSVAYRAELITRTALSQVMNVASEARMQQIRTQFPDVRERLQQVFVSVQIGEWPCKICEPFDGKIFEFDDPDKPQPPLHPNCRCALVPFVKGVSRIRSVPEPEAKRQVEKSIVESCCSCDFIHSEYMGGVSTLLHDVATFAFSDYKYARLS